MLTEKENFLRVLNGEMPEWIPIYTLMKMPGSDIDPCNIRIEPPVVNEHRIRGGGRDIWGVEFITSAESAGAIMPKTWDFILDDITKWRDVIKAPSLEGVDWEDMVNKHLKSTGINREKTALSFRLHIGYFQALMSFMGFENGLMALYEEPEEALALLDYLCTFYEKVCDNCIDLYKPDVINITDDTAAWNSPFISLEMYRKYFLPCYKRLAKYAHDRGLPITFHNCGKCEAFVDDMVSIGVRGWDPAQTCNDLTAIKKKHQGKLALMGGWDGRGRLLEPDVTDEEIRQSVIDTLDKLAQGGGYMWCGGFMGADFNDPVIRRKNKILMDTVAEYGKQFCC